jgi:hypothetical protein
MAEPLPTTTLAWLRQTAKFEGAVTAQVLLHLLERVEALEAAEHFVEVPKMAPTAPPPLPPGYIDPEHQGDDLRLLEVFYRACYAEGGTADEIHLRGIRAVLAAGPATPPAPEPGEGEGPNA